MGVTEKGKLFQGRAGRGQHAADDGVGVIARDVEQMHLLALQAHDLDQRGVPGAERRPPPRAEGHAVGGLVGAGFRRQAAMMHLATLIFGRIAHDAGTIPRHSWKRISTAGKARASRKARAAQTS